MPIDLRFVAEQCVALVAEEFSQRLDWSVESLVILDDVCSELLADGPLADDRLELWWKLIGAYTGEVLIRTYGGSWSDAETPRVVIKGNTAMPFTIAHRVLSGEPYKSLASFGRMFPALLARAEEG